MVSPDRLDVALTKKLAAPGNRTRAIRHIPCTKLTSIIFRIEVVQGCLKQFVFGMNVSDYSDTSKLLIRGHRNHVYIVTQVIYHISTDLRCQDTG